MVSSYLGSVVHDGWVVVRTRVDDGALGSVELVQIVTYVVPHDTDEIISVHPATKNFPGEFLAQNLLLDIFTG